MSESNNSNHQIDCLPDVDHCWTCAVHSAQFNMAPAIYILKHLRDLGIKMKLTTGINWYWKRFSG